MPSDEVMEKLINLTCPALVPAIALLIVAIAGWIKARSIEGKIDANAVKVATGVKTLAKKTDYAVETFTSKTDEQTKILTDGHAELTDKVNKIEQQTNGLLEAVVKDAGDKSLVSGVKSETDKEST